MGQSSVRLSADEFHQRIVEFDSVICNSDTMLHAIKHDRHSRTPHAHGLRLRRLCMDLPLSSNGLVMVSGLESERSNIYTAPFTSQAWYAIAAMMNLHTEHQCYGMDARVDQYTTRHPDSQHASLSWSPCISIHSVYRTRHMLHLLIALYTANLIRGVAGRRLIGNNVKRSSCPSYRSVSSGGPVLQMGYEFRDTLRRFQPKPQRRLYHPSCCGHRARGWWPSHAIRSFP
jgi:hypothetical protein